MVSSKPWQLEPVVRLVARLMICFVIGALTTQFLRQWLGERAIQNVLLPLIVSIVCMHGAALVLVGLFVREQQSDWPSAFGFKNQVGWAVLLGICAAIIVLPACWRLQTAMAQWLSQLGFDVSEQDPVKMLWSADTLWKQTLLGVFAVVIAPVAEELFFRGIAYPVLKQYFHRQFALWVTAVLFALVHGNIVVVVPLIVLAVVLTLLYEWTGNLLACIVVHSLFNAANFGLLFVLKHAAGPHLQ